MCVIHQIVHFKCVQYINGVSLILNIKYNTIKVFKSNYTKGFALKLLTA